MRTGVWLVGARGSVAVTSIVGALALRAGLAEPTGCVTELPAAAQPRAARPRPTWCSAATTSSRRRW